MKRTDIGILERLTIWLWGYDKGRRLMTSAEMREYNLAREEAAEQGRKWVEPTDPIAFVQERLRDRDAATKL